MAPETQARLRRRGIFVVIEGIDGTGKTTQAALLADALRGAGLAPVASREPTGGYWGRKIRESAQRGRMPLEEELEAFIEDRAEHVRLLIQPALDAGEIVILDRYFYSTIAYQGGRGGNVSVLQARMEALFPIPDAVYLLDLDPTAALERIAGLRKDTPDEFERPGALARTREIFRQLSGPILKIDAAQPPEAIHEQLLSAFVHGPLRAARCAVEGGCADPVQCSYARQGQCEWWELRRRLLAAPARPTRL